MRNRVIDPNYDHKVIEEDNRTYWERTRTYRKLKRDKKDGKSFFINDGPPFALSQITLGMIRNKVTKDSIIRYKRSRGFNVRDQPCFDMHGIPIELAVEEEMGIKDKKEIVERGVDSFTLACKEMADKNYLDMTHIFKSLNIWMDWENPCLTSDNSYIESAWFALKKAHDDQLLNQEKRLVQWCPRCESSLAEQEVVYRNVTDRAVYVKFPIKGRRDEYIVIWTIYPWTLPANLAIAVNPTQKYARVTIRKGGKKEIIILLESKIKQLIDIVKIDAFEIMETLSGEELKGLEYFHPMMGDIKYQRNVKGQWVHKIITSDMVGTRRTGVVNIAPGHGPLDFDLGNEYNIPAFCPIDERGVFTTAVGMKYGGKYVKDAEEAMINDLKDMRFILHDHDVEHRKGFCWRCDAPIVHRVTKQWFLDINEVSDKMVRAIHTIDWSPKQAGNELFERSQHSTNWCISRQRYWGIPIPIWECLTDICGHQVMVGSIKDIARAHGYSKDMDLHIPSIDNVSLECPKCMGLMKRVPDIVDVWFDSSINSWAQLNYPRKKKDFKQWWPAEIICEDRKQIKSWLYCQLNSSLIVFGKIPFRSSIVQGHISIDPAMLAKENNSEKDAIHTVLDSYGVDALRLALLAKPTTWATETLTEHDVRQAYKVVKKLWNITYFTTQYISINELDTGTKDLTKLTKKMQIEDKWLLSTLETLAKNVEKSYDINDMEMAVRSLSSFIVNDLSNTYLRIIKNRMKDVNTDKEPLLLTLNHTLEKLSIMLAPICPNISEQIYQNLDGKELSIHLLEWPKANKSFLNEGFETVMESIRDIAHAVYKVRHLVSHRNRWPVKNLVIEVYDHDLHESIMPFADVLAVLTNAKEVEFVPEGHEWEGRELEVIPNPKIIGKAYKQWESKIAMMLKFRPAKEIKERIEKGEYYLGIEGQKLQILPEMVNFTTKLPANIISEDFNKGVIYVDVDRDDEHITECYTLDIIRRIQDMRKDMALDMEEYINIQLTINDDLLDRLIEGDWLDTIADRTNASQIEIVEEIDEVEFIIEWDVDGETVVIGIGSMNVKKAMDDFTKIPAVTKDIALSLINSGITDMDGLQDAEREFLLKIAGINHAKIRKIKEYFDTPEELRNIRYDNVCPVCDGEIKPGVSFCNRCEAKLTEDDNIDVEFIGDIVDDAEEFDEDHDDLGEYHEHTEDIDRPAIRAKPTISTTDMPTDGEVIVIPEDDSQEYEYIKDMDVEDISIEVSARPLVEETSDEDIESSEPAVIKRAVIGGDRDEVIVTISELFGLSPAVAKNLYENGYDSTESFEKASESDLRNVKGIGKVSARKIIRIISGEEEKLCSLCNAIVEKDAVECVRCGTRFAGAASSPVIKKEEIPEMDIEESPKPEPKKINDSEEELSTEDVEKEKQFDDEQEDREVVEPESDGHSSEEEAKVESIIAMNIDEDASASNKELEDMPAGDAAEIDETEITTETENTTKISTKDADGQHDDEKDEPPIDGETQRELDDIGQICSEAIGLRELGNIEEALKTIVKGLVLYPGDGKLLREKEDLEVELELMVEDNILVYEDEGSPLEIIIDDDGDRPENIIAESGKNDKTKKKKITKTLKTKVVINEDMQEDNGENDEKDAGTTVIVAGKLPSTSEPRKEEDILKESYTYLIPEDRGQRSYNYLTHEIENGRKAFCVTRSFPEKIRAKFDLGDTPILWLSNVGKENSIRPKDLEKLSLSFEQFLAEEGVIILLDGIEYLITNNKFITVLRLIQSLRDQVAINRSILLISVNASTLEKNELNLLEREVDLVL